MGNCIAACDAHKKYSLFGAMDGDTCERSYCRVNHVRGAIEAYVSGLPQGTPVALETVGNWYWIVDEIEAGGGVPLMAHAAKAKVMMGNTNKTDKLDVDGLLTLLRNGTLPTVWLPGRPVRDLRELYRTRINLGKQRTALKNRVQATVAKYGLHAPEGDLFCGKGREWLIAAIPTLPPETGLCVEQQLQVLDAVQEHIDALTKRIREQVKLNHEMQLLTSLPGIGDIFAIVVAMEMGSVGRFPRVEQFASYAGTVPKVTSSGDKRYYGHTRKDCNRYLKWAFFEAADVVASQRNRPGWGGKHVVQLYERVRKRRGHGIAVGAVARHLAEAAYWVLKRNEPYRDPNSRKDLPKQR